MKTTTTTAVRTSLLDLDPVEMMILIAYISMDAIIRLIQSPPQIWKPAAATVPYSSAAIALSESFAASVAMSREADRIKRFIYQPQAAEAPSRGITPVLTVSDLRTMARAEGLAAAAGRPIHRARRADLLAALGL